MTTYEHHSLTEYRTPDGRVVAYEDGATLDELRSLHARVQELEARPKMSLVDVVDAIEAAKRYVTKQGGISDLHDSLAGVTHALGRFAASDPSSRACTVALELSAAIDPGLPASERRAYALRRS